MNASLLESMLRRVAPLAADRRAADADLLRLFTTARDETAFAALVQRHGPMVWSVCRNLLPTEADAEDAFQATFIALIRSASRIRTPNALGSWLYGVAYRVAQKARRSAARRHKHEQNASTREAACPVANRTWAQLQAAVHDELNRLPESLRTAFVTCELEGIGQREAAEALGLKLGTLSARLTRARQRLIERLSRQGIPAGLAVAGSLVGGSATATAPANLTAKVLALARSGINWNESVSATILQLARGANEVSMTRTKMIAAAIALTITLAAGTATILVPMATAQRPASNQALDQPAEGQPDAQSPFHNFNRFQTIGDMADQWEYKFVPRKSDSLEAFEKILATAGAEGWEYCGTESLIPTNPSRKAQWGTGPTIVFKRPKSSARADREMLNRLEQMRNQPAQSSRGSTSSSAGSSGPIGGSTGRVTTSPKGGMPMSPSPGAQRQEISIIRLENANAAELSQTLTQLFAGHGRILADSRSNSLVIQADKEMLVEIAAVIQKLDSAATRSLSNPASPKRP